MVHRKWTAVALFALSCVNVSCKKVAETGSVKDVSSSGKTPGVSSSGLLYHGMSVDSGSMTILANNPPASRPAVSDPELGLQGASKKNSLKEDQRFGLAGDVKTTYMTSCEAAGVPLPPAWGNAEWKLEGALARDKVLVLDTLNKTELWTYRNDKGTCAALPRMANNDGVINFMGIICANKVSGKTCFFDNVSPKDGSTKVGVPVGYKISDGTGGDRLVENCTQCHRGDNPWIVVPGQPTENLESPDGGYIPMGKSDWVNLISKVEVGPGCASCHKMPVLTTGYCTVASAMFERDIMPYSDTGKVSKKGVFEVSQACLSLFATEGLRAPDYLVDYVKKNPKKAAAPTPSPSPSVPTATDPGVEASTSTASDTSTDLNTFDDSF